jgi:hypothetical protein
MKIVTNEPLIKRNGKIGQYTTVASLIILAGGLYLSFQSSAQMFTWSFVALILGFVLSQIGIFFGNKFGKHPRPDEQITAALKGLDDKYTLYHYRTPASHLLVGPAGVWVVLPFSQGGVISYEKNRWKQKGGNWYLKLFGQENLGRPDQDARTEINSLNKFLTKLFPDLVVPDIQAILVFLSPKAKVADVENAPCPAVELDKLKDFIRRSAKEDALPLDWIVKLKDALPAE